MSEQEEILMAKYGITCESKMIYRYKEHRYESLKDALNYAMLDTKLIQESNLPTEK